MYDKIFSTILRPGIKSLQTPPYAFFPKRRIQKLKEPTILRNYQDTLTRILDPNIDSDDVGVLWEHLKTSLLSATEEACGWTSKRKRRETWWWNGLVQYFVKENGKFKNRVLIKNLIWIPKKLCTMLNSVQRTISLHTFNKMML